MSAFDKCWTFALQAGVQLSRTEAEYLFHYAQRYPDEVVEVGTFSGGSACILAAAARRVTLLDPDQACAAAILTNLARTPWFERVSIIMSPDNLIWPFYPRRVSLLFLDHEHSWSAVRNSLYGWRHTLARQSVVVCHDYNENEYPEVKRAIDQSGIGIIETYESIAVCTWNEALVKEASTICSQRI